MIIQILVIFHFSNEYSKYINNKHQKINEEREENKHEYNNHNFGLKT